MRRRHRFGRWTATLAWIGLFVVFYANTAMAAKTVVTFAHPYADIPGLVKAYEAAADAFNQAHPDLEVQIVDFPAGQGNQVEKITVATIAGVAPDVVHVWGVGTAVDMFNAGLTLDIGPYLSRVPEWQPARGEYVAPFIDMFRWQGALVGLPSSAGAAVATWSATLFSEAGLDARRGPAGLQEAREFARKLVRMGPDGQLERIAFDPLDTWWAQFAIPAWFGQPLYDRSADRVMVNTGAMRDMFAWLHSLYDAQGGFGQVRAFAGDEASQMASGRLAMIQTSPGVLNRILQANTELVPGETLMVGPTWLAEGHSGAGSIAVGDANVVLRTAREPAAAVRFLVEMSVGRSFEAWGRLWPLFSASQAVNRRLLQEAAADPTRRVVAEAAVRSIGRTIAFPAFPETGILLDALNDWSGVLERQVGVDAFLTDVERTVSAAMAERRSAR